jgi:hypothetical protein
MDVEKHEVEQAEFAELADVDPKKLKKLVRKIDMWLMPTIWVIYLFSFVVSRVNPRASQSLSAEHD